MLNCLRCHYNFRFLQHSIYESEPELKNHVISCPRCRDAFAPDILSHQLIESLKRVEPVTPSPDFYTGIQRRIRVMQAQQRQNSPLPTEWEGVILQFQRVILSGAAAAALCIGLLAYAQSSTSMPTVSRDSGLESYISPTQGDRMIITRSDPISQDDVLFALVTEDPEYARQ